MMGIAQKVARNFSDAVRSRGQSYFAKGRVTLMAARPGEVVARVRGTTKYRVRVRLRGSKLLASCRCPYFSPQGEPCKHLWATLLLADSRGFLQSAPSFPVRLIAEAPAPRRRRVCPGDPRAGARADGPAPGRGPCRGGWTWAASRRPGCRRASARGRGPKERPAAVPGPRGHAARPATGPGHRPGPLRRGTAGSPGRGKVRPGTSPAAARARQGGQPQRQAAPGLRPRRAATLTQNQVVIDLARRQRKPTGEWGPLRPWWYAPRARARQVRPRGPPAPGPARRGPPRDGPRRPTRRMPPTARRRPAACRRRRCRPGAGAGPARVPSELRGTRRFVLRKDQAALVERLAQDGPAPAPPHRGRGRPADDALGRRPALAVLPGHPHRAGRQALGLARRAPPRGEQTAWTWPSRWCSCPAC